jgi:hypothetical protein
MSKKIRRITLALVLILGAAFWWITVEMKDQNDPLNQSDAFVYSNNGMLYWFDLKTRKGQVEGSFHLQKLIEETGDPPFIEEKINSLNGEKTEKGYKFKVSVDDEVTSFDAWFSGPHLAVQKHGEEGSTLYNPVDQEELGEYVDALFNYHAEEKEKERLKAFFSELRQVYGYLHTSTDGSYQLLIKVDEALLEGELTGTLLMRTATGDINQLYKETRYVLNGITDGLMLEFYTTVDEKMVKMTGEFHGNANSFDLSFWNTDKNLTFYAVTEEEFKQSRE